eukprot:1501141-Prymnesium_polylepis.1
MGLGGRADAKALAARLSRVQSKLPRRRVPCRSKAQVCPSSLTLSHASPETARCPPLLRKKRL